MEIGTWRCIPPSINFPNGTFRYGRIWMSNCSFHPCYFDHESNKTYQPNDEGKSIVQHYNDLRIVRNCIRIRICSYLQVHWWKELEAQHYLHSSSFPWNFDDLVPYLEYLPHPLWISKECTHLHHFCSILPLALCCLPTRICWKFHRIQA